MKIFLIYEFSLGSFQKILIDAKLIFLVQ